ncbi:hypothetical protein ISCGN_022372 [Ixodes scapularis]
MSSVCLARVFKTPTPNRGRGSSPKMAEETGIDIWDFPHGCLLTLATVLNLTYLATNSKRSGQDYITQDGNVDAEHENYNIERLGFYAKNASCMKTPTRFMNEQQHQSR